MVLGWVTKKVAGRAVEEGLKKGAKHVMKKKAVGFKDKAKRMAADRLGVEMPEAKPTDLRSRVRGGLEFLQKMGQDEVPDTPIAAPIPEPTMKDLTGIAAKQAAGKFSQTAAPAAKVGKKWLKALEAAGKGHDKSPKA